MNLLAFLLAAQATQVAPYIVLPEPGLDDPAAYEGYATRVYRDASGNALQIYIDANSGRVVHLWADALNESIGFTVRGEGGQEAKAAVAFGEEAATVGATGGRRWLRYSLTVPAGRSVRIGHFLLGSMRIERDFGYAGRVRDPIDAPTFVVPEFTRLAERLGPPYRERLTPRFAIDQSEGRWFLRVMQPSLDGKNHLWLSVSGDAAGALVALRQRILTMQPSRTGEPYTLTVEVTTDGAPLTPLDRVAIFNDAFRRFVDSARAPRLERQIRGVELLSSRQKVMAGLPNYATYFGRDMLMTALLMEPVWADTIHEFVMAAALGKLAPSGEVSHEEAVGGQAIRENAAEFLKTRDRRLLRNLQATRENYWMVDDDFQLAVVAGRYFADPDVAAERKRRFMRRWGNALRRNLAYVWRQAAPYANDPRATNLVGFRRDDDGWWHPGSWRDSRVGYAGGRFAYDVNVVWVPAALRAIGTIDSALQSMGEPGVAGAVSIAAAATVWDGTARHFAVALAASEVEARVRAKLASLPEPERAHWTAVLARAGFPSDTLRFPAVALDGAGVPIPVMSTDPAMWLLLARQDSARERTLLRPFLLPYPIGLYIDSVGPVTANDAYAAAPVREMFERDLYHSPRVVWGRDVNTLLAALAVRHGPRATAAIDSIRGAVRRSGLEYNELWSYRIGTDGLRAVRYGSSSDVQLWSLTDLAVQFLLARLSPSGR